MASDNMLKVIVTYERDLKAFREKCRDLWPTETVRLVRLHERADHDPGDEDVRR